MTDSSALAASVGAALMARATFPLIARTELALL